MEGWLLKQGERGVVKGFKKRWFEQSGYVLKYSKTKLDVKLGEIDIKLAISCFRVADNTRSRFQVFYVIYV